MVGGFKKVLLFSASLFVSSSFFLIVFMSVTDGFLSFPEVVRIKKVGEGVLPIDESEKINFLLLSNSDKFPSLEDEDEFLSIKNDSCFSVIDLNFRIQMTDISGNAISGVALFSVLSKCSGVKELVFFADQEYLEKHGYFLGYQGGYRDFFVNAIMMVLLSLIFSIIVYKVVICRFNRGRRKV